MTDAMTPADIVAMQADMMAGTPGDWFVSGVRFKMNNSQWQGIMRYDEAAKRDENIAAVGYDPRTGLGWPDALRIARVPRMEATIIADAAIKVAQAAEIARLLHALVSIGRQELTFENGGEGDFEYGYDILIKIARAAVEGTPK